MGTLCTSADLPVAQPRGSPVSDLGWSWPFRLDCEEIFTSLQWLSSVKKVLGQTLDLSFSLSLFLLSGSPWHGLWGGASHRAIAFHFRSTLIYLGTLILNWFSGKAHGETRRRRIIQNCFGWLKGTWKCRCRWTCGSMRRQHGIE